MVGPDYQTPEAQEPTAWSIEDPDLFKKPSKDDSIAWWTLFNDPVLDQLVATAFEQNLELRSAGLRIIEARAQLGRVKGSLYPQVQEMQGDLFTIGDIGFLDEDGFLYLTDRQSNMIISGGVNIYPQEAENVLTMHPKVLDVAVFGVPNEDFGEEVKAVVQPIEMPVDDWNIA